MSKAPSHLTDQVEGHYAFCKSISQGKKSEIGSIGGPKTPVNNNGKFFKRHSDVSFTHTSNNDQSVFSSSMDDDRP